MKTIDLFFGLWLPWIIAVGAVSLHLAGIITDTQATYDLAVAIAMRVLPGREL